MTDEQLGHAIEKGEHHHLPDKDQVQIYKFQSTLNKLAFNETLPIPMIYREETTKFSRQNEGAIIAPPFLSVQSNLYQIRHKNMPPLQSSLESLDIPLNLRTTTSGANFILY